MRKVVRIKTNKIKNTIIQKVFDNVGNSLINEIFADDLDFILSIKRIAGIESARSFPVESGYRYEYKVHIDDDLGVEINNFKNQIKFEKLGMWIIYDFTYNILRVTLID